MDNNIIYMFQHGVPIKGIAKILGIDERKISKRLDELGIRKRRKKVLITAKELTKAEFLHSKGMSLNEVADNLGRSTSGLISALAKKNIKLKTHDQRKYSCNDNIFNQIDTEEKAYWLGYMYADGYNREEENYISFTQAKQDKTMVYKFKEFLEFNGPVTIMEKSKQNNNWQDAYTIQVTSQQISQDLARHGCMQAKTHLIEFPNTNTLPKHLQRHFIRGYFDGDGSVQLNRWDMVGTEEFLLDVQKILMSELGLNKTKLNERHSDRNTNIRTLIYGGRLVLEKIYSYLYDDATIWSERKYESFTDYRKQQKAVVIKHAERRNKRNLEIIRLHSEGVDKTEIAKQFKLTRSTVNKVLNS